LRVAKLIPKAAADDSYSTKLLYQPALIMTHHALHVMAGLDPAIHAFDAAHAEPQRVKTDAVWYYQAGIA